MTTLTEADMRTIASALNRAMDERSSYAASWPTGAPERDEALRQVRVYEALHIKIFGGKSARQARDDHMNSLPLVPITELHKR